MRIDIISAAPNLLESPFNHSIVKRAKEKGLAEIVIHDLRTFGLGNYKQIDDTQFGGGAGMVLMIEPISKCIDALKAERRYDEIIYMTPDAKTLNQSTANTLSLQENILILTGHYKGVDQRVRDMFVTKEISIGDYVLNGGEVAALVMIEAISRLIPGVIGNPESLAEESHNEIGALEYPTFTKPAQWRGLTVPEVLMSGNHGQIAQWRRDEALRRSKLAE